MKRHLAGLSAGPRTGVRLATTSDQIDRSPRTGQAGRDVRTPPASHRSEADRVSWLGRVPGRLLGLVQRHRLFTGLLVVAALLRICASLAYRPAIWFNAAFEYVAVALRPQPYAIPPTATASCSRP